jgi:hypothetical protein
MSNSENEPMDNQPNSIRKSMKSLFFAALSLACANSILAQKVRPEDLYGRWSIGGDSIVCSSGAVLIEENKGKAITFFKDGTAKCTDPKDAVFADILHWSVPLDGSALVIKRASGKIDRFTPTIVRRGAHFACGTQKPACGKNDDYGTLYRTITLDTSAKRIELIGENEIVQAPDEMPAYPGGAPELQKWLLKNLKTPKYAKGDVLPGKLNIILTVEKTGKISEVSVFGQRWPDGINKENEQRLLKMKKWQPGKVDGQSVRSAFSTRVVFEFK